jgi:hypothetical protein
MSKTEKVRNNVKKVVKFTAVGYVILTGSLLITLGVQKATDIVAATAIKILKA